MKRDLDVAKSGSQRQITKVQMMSSLLFVVADLEPFRVVGAFLDGGFSGCFVQLLPTACSAVLTALHAFLFLHVNLLCIGGHSALMLM